MPQKIKISEALLISFTKTFKRIFMEPIIFIEGNSKNFEDTIQLTMEKPIKHYEKELSGIRTGRASTRLIEAHPRCNDR